ncbi:MAG: DUF2332 family protein [Pseudomonadota bacterium]
MPLRLAGGLHALHLLGRGGLGPVYPPNAVADDDLWSAVRNAMRTEAAFLDSWLDRPPQTNELQRAGPVRAAAQWVAAHHGLPLEVWEVGASAGLNLNWDRFALHLGDQVFGPSDTPVALRPEWDGPLPPKLEPRVVAKAGVDLTPLDPATDHLRLKAYLWPDQADRLTRMEAALTLPQTPVDAGCAADWLEARLAQTRPAGQTLFLFHTIAWQYFPPDVQARATAALERAGAAATEDRPLAWFGIEADDATPGAGMVLRLWPGGTIHDAGRTDFHGRWVQWRLPPPAHGAP